jgi:vacuolar-type H+-ATPase subunit I/STV1
MTAAARQQRKRDRQKAGLVRVEVWVPADKVERISKAIDRIMNAEHESTPAPGVE